MEKTQPKLLSKEEYEKLWKQHNDISNKKMSYRQWVAYYNRQHMKEFVGKVGKKLVKAIKKGKGKGGISIDNIIGGLRAVNDY